MDAHLIQNWQAPDLAKLNLGGVELMKMRLVKLLDEIREKRGNSKEKIRILDIGCGNSLYFFGIDLSDVELTLTDRVDLSDSNDAERPYKPFDSLKFMEFNFPDGELKKPLGKFDIIILSAVLHELYQQWNLKNLSEDSNVNIKSDFSTWFFQQFKNLGLMSCKEGTDSFVLIGEIYHRNLWSHEALERARKVQYKLIKHADPPSAFPDPMLLVHGARELGYILERFDESYSVPDDHIIFNEPGVSDDEEVKLIFRNRRFAAQTYKCTQKIYATKTDSTENKKFEYVSLKGLISDAVHSSKKLSDNFDVLNKFLKKWSDNSITIDSLDDEYNKVFIRDEEINEKTPGIFLNLSKECAILIRNYFLFVKMVPPENLAFWFSVNSSVLPNISRYLPKIEQQYICIHTNPSKLHNHNIDNQIEFDGKKWSAIAFNTLLGELDTLLPDTTIFKGIKPPSLFQWLNHKNITKPPKSISITYARPDYEHQNAPVCYNNCSSLTNKSKVELKHKTKLPVHRGVLSSSMEDAIAVSNIKLWKDNKDKNAIDDEHVMILIPNDTFNNKKAGAYINTLTDSVYCGAQGEDDKIVAIKKSMASIYLDFIFLQRCIDCDIDANASADDKVEKGLLALSDFKERWDCDEISNGISVFSNEAELKEEFDKNPLAILPTDYMARITRVCSLAEELIKRGEVLPKTWISLSPTSLVREMHDSNIPGNVMFFTDRMFGTMLLDLITVEADKAFQAVHTIELEWKTKKFTADETRSDTFSLMLTSFGHDGKRPAMTIEMALKNISISDKSARALALYSAHSLVNRLASYSRIPIETQDNDYIVKQLESEAVSPFSSVNVERLWQIEALNQFIRILVDESEWRVIRDEGLFTTGFDWNEAENLIEPLITLSSSNNDVYEDNISVETYIAACLQNLSSHNPPINIMYEGPTLLCPKQLSGINNSPTIAKLCTILSFVFAELMTNMARHVWKTYRDGVKKEGLFYALRVRTESDGYYLDVCFAPSHTSLSPDPVLTGENRTITGLMSIKLALLSVAAKAQEQLVTWEKDGNKDNAKSFGMQPLPRQSNEIICGHLKLWTITTIGPVAFKAFKEAV